jgi:hypothetical protein
VIVGETDRAKETETEDEGGAAYIVGGRAGASGSAGETSGVAWEGGDVEMLVKVEKVWWDGKAVRAGWRTSWVG